VFAKLLKTEALAVTGDLSDLIVRDSNSNGVAWDMWTFRLDINIPFCSRECMDMFDKAFMIELFAFLKDAFTVMFDEIVFKIGEIDKH